MRLKIFPIAIAIFLAFVLYRELERSNTVILPPVVTNKIKEEVHQKISTFKSPSRVEVRNYIKDEKHKYQADVLEIKKLKIKLDPQSKIYIQLNLFVNESDPEAPMIAQFLIFDSTTQNLIQEENLSLSH